MSKTASKPAEVLQRQGKIPPGVSDGAWLCMLLLDLQPAEFKRINSYCLSDPVCDTLLQQLQETNTNGYELKNKTKPTTVDGEVVFLALAVTVVWQMSFTDSLPYLLLPE